MDNVLNETRKPDFEVIKAGLFNKKSDEESHAFNLSNSNMLKPFSINNLDFKNHFLFTNLTDIEFFDNENFDFCDYYLKIAKSNVGLIITGGVDLKLLNKKIRLNNDKDLMLIKNQINGIHSYGTKIFLQIKQFYGRGIDLNKCFNKLNYSASFNHSYNNSENMCMRFSDFKCDEMIHEIKELCRFAKSVGFDGVLINGDLFNIIGELSSVEFNKRYFGYYSNVGEFTIKLLKALKFEFDNFNIFYSITIDSCLKEIYGNQLKNMKTTAKINRFTDFNNLNKFLIEMVNNGIDGFVFNFGTYENEFLNVYNEFQSEYIFYNYYKQIKEFFKSNNIKNKFGYDVTLIYKDNINNLKKAELYFNKNIFDFLDITKQIFADENYLLNLTDNIINKNCIKCGFCDNYAKRFNKNYCYINPELFLKDSNKLNLTINNHIAIIGGGLSGLMCAIYLIKRGFKVDIYEKNNILNKKRRAYEIYNFCKLNKNFNDYIEDFLLKNANNCQIYLNNDIKQGNLPLNNEYRAIIVSTGAHEKFLNILGSILKSVISLNDILIYKKIVDKFDNFVILAKSELSLKFALYLLSINKKVSIIFQNFDNIITLSNDRFSYYFYKLTNLNANIYIDARVKKIENDFIELIINKNINKQNILSTIINLKTNAKIKKSEKLVLIDYDCFIYEPDLYENNKLYYDIVMSGFTGEVYMIGNALKICDDAECIKSAYFVAKNL